MSEGFHVLYAKAEYDIVVTNVRRLVCGPEVSVRFHKNPTFHQPPRNS